MQMMVQTYATQEPGGVRLRGGVGVAVVALHVGLIAWLLFGFGPGIPQPAPDQAMMVMMIPAPEQPPAPPPPPIPKVEKPPIIATTRQVEAAPTAPVIPPDPVEEVVTEQPVIDQPPAPPAPPSPPAPPAPPAVPMQSVRMAYLNNPLPRYPDHLRRRGIQGKTFLRVLVSPEGRVLQIELNRSSGNTELDASAMKGVRDWKFAPFTGPGAVAGWAIIPINFKLEK